LVAVSFNLTSLTDDRQGLKKSPGSHREAKTRKKSAGRRRDESGRARSPQNASNPYDADESDSEEVPSGYHQVSIQVGSVLRAPHGAGSGSYVWHFQHQHFIEQNVA
jgi:hypothetical protein